MNDEQLKIAFVHKGHSWYLPYVLNQAVAFNKDNVVFIGDGQLKYSRNNEIENINMNNLKNKMSLQFIENYTHCSTNPYDYELFCWLRWFYLLEYMKHNNIEKIFYSDSDGLVYESTNEIYSIYELNKFECGLVVPFQVHDFLWAASGEFSFWTLDSLQDFCQFCLDSFRLNMYKDKILWHEKNKKVSGGISDMASLYLWWLKNQESIYNFAKRTDSIVIDNNINISNNFTKNEYKKNKLLGLKKVIFKDKEPYFVDHKNNMVRSLSLQFQGSAKCFIPYYANYPGKRNNFKNYGRVLIKRVAFPVARKCLLR